MLYFKSKLSFLVLALSLNIAWVVYNYEKFLTSSAHPIASISYEDFSSMQIDLELCSSNFVVAGVFCYIQKNESWPQCSTQSHERCQTFRTPTSKDYLLFEYQIYGPEKDAIPEQLQLKPVRLHLPGVSYELDSASQLTFIVQKDSNITFPLWYWFDSRVVLLDHRHQGGSVTAQVTLYLVGSGPSRKALSEWEGFGVYQPSSQTFFVQTLTYVNQFGPWDALTACTFALNACVTAFALIFPYRVLLSSPRVLQPCCCRRKTSTDAQLLSSP